MKRLGICKKCGKETTVQDHHINGYLGENKDKVVPYCQSCDQKAHYKAIRENKCKLNIEERKKLTVGSCNRRSKKHLMLSNITLETNIGVYDYLQFNINTKHIIIWSYFSGRRGKKLKIIDEK